MSTAFGTLPLAVLLLFSSAGAASAAAPVLHFSDIISGPKTGLGDGKGSGAIVTVWGVNLGSTQGGSQISIGGVPAAHVYYWGNADTTGASGPADLYAYHKMQTVSFSIPAGAPDGLTNIQVTVGGTQSNTLPFTVRAGNIFFVKTTGVDGPTASGSWTSPWRTMNYVGNGSGNAGAGGRVTAGDIIYAGDGVTEIDGFDIKYIKATATNPIFVTAYPGARVTVRGNRGNPGIGNWNHEAAYWSFSKFIIEVKSDGIGTFKGMRAVANEITNYPGFEATGAGGAITGDNINFPNDPTRDVVGGGIKAFGNYIHAFGGPTTDPWHHVFYISNRGGYAVEAYELGWNNLGDNGAYHALHIYDEGRSGDWTGIMNIHDNVVKNQSGVGFGLSSGGITPGVNITVPINVYNNLFINVGALLGGSEVLRSYAIGMSGPNAKSHIKIYNNIFYGFGDITATNPAFFADMSSGVGVFGGSWEFVNNLVVNTNNVSYWINGNGFAFVNPTVSRNNLWYNPSGIIPAPTWDTSPSTSNPLFINPTLGDFHLQSTSPAINTGSSLVSSIVTRDLDANPRPQGSGYDIGAFELNSAASLAPAAPRGLRTQP